MITYANQNGRKIGTRRGWDIDVYLDGKRIGAIVSVADGYRYKPEGRKPGATFPSIEAVKASLEEA